MADETARPQTLRYEDNPAVMECFADSIGQWFFDGTTLRIEFTVTRLDDEKQGAAASGRRVPVARVVLTPGAAVDLMNRSGQLAGALKKLGLVKSAEKPAAAARS